MLSSDEIHALPEDALEALKSVSQRLYDMANMYVGSSGKGVLKIKFDIVIKGYALLIALIEKAEKTDPELYSNIKEIKEFKIINDETKYAIIIKDTAKRVLDFSTFHIAKRDIHQVAVTSIDEYRGIVTGFKNYIITDDDFSMIQKNINEIREIIASSDLIADDHKYRLQSKLEQLQLELHKKMSSLTRVLGLLVEVGTSIGIVGERIKPATDRVCEILQSLLHTKSKAEGLPPSSISTLALPSPETDK
jgi:hypothetical protein